MMYRNYDNRNFNTRYLKLAFYAIGGRWGYASMIIKDDNDELKIRLAKCKKNNYFPDTSYKKWIDVDVKHVSNLSQASKINFKLTDNLFEIMEQVEMDFEEINYHEEFEFDEWKIN